MADDDTGNQGEGTGDDGGDDNQTVTREQFDELNAQLEASNKMFEELKKAQSGSDSKVTELQNLLKQTKEKAEEAGKTEKQKFADRMTAIETELADEKSAKQKAILKGLAIQLLSDKKISAPKYLNRLIGKDAEETEANIMDYIEERLALELSVADEFAKNNGRRVQKTSGKGDMKTLDDFTDDEIKSMSDAEFLKVQERSKK